MGGILFLIASLFAATVYSSDIPTQAKDFKAEADKNFATLHYKDAEAQYEQTLKIFLDAGVFSESSQNDNSSIIADCFQKLGKIHNKFSEFDKALESLEKAKKIHEELGSQAEIAIDLTEIARVQMNISKFPQALELSNQAMKIHEQAGNRKGVADCLRTIADINRRMGKYDDALQFANKSLTEAQASEDNKAIASSLNIVGAIQNNLGSYDEALTNLKKALQVAEASGDQWEIAPVLSNTGAVYGAMGNRTEARDYFQRSLKIREELQDSLGVAVSLNNIGIVNHDLGNYTQALDCYKRSLKMLQEIGDKNKVAMSFNNIGAVNVELGNYTEALERYLDSLKIKDEIGDKRGAATSLNNIGIVHWNLHQFNKALEYHRKALGIREEIGDKNGISMSLNNLGRVYRDMGNASEAAKNFDEAIKIREQIGDKSGLAWSLYDLGSLYYQQKDMEQAEKNLSEAIRISQEIEFPEVLWPSLHKKALIYRDTGKKDEAIALLKDSIGIIEKLRSKLLQAEQKSAYLQNKIEVYEDLISLLYQTSQNVEAFNYEQRAKARSFLDLLEESRAAVNITQGVDPDLLEREREIQAKLSNVQLKLDAERSRPKKDENRIAGFEKERDRIYRDYEELKAEIRSRNPRYAELKYSDPAQLSEIQNLLDGDTLLLEYLLGDHESFLFAITKDQYEMFKLPAREEIEKRVERLRDSIADFGNLSAQTFYLQESSKLFIDLIGPLKTFGGKKTKLLIAPDGSLYHLPFQALTTTETESAGQIEFQSLPYLAKRYQISYIQSASILKIRGNQHENSGTQKKLLAFADPIYGKNQTDQSDYVLQTAYGETNQELKRLTFSNEEVRGISNLFPKANVKLCLRDQATEDNVKRMNLEEYQMLHFAVHGIANETKPQFSSIVLGRASNSTEDGYLQMYEIFNLKMKAHLAILSACESGLGKKVRGEGIIGLTRAFEYAGAQNVMVSLWKINDRSTAEFMTSFYKKLQRDGDDKAVEEAELEMIRGKYSHPYYWAAFALYGQ